MIKAIQAAFPDIGLTYSIGGQLSFDAFPTGMSTPASFNPCIDAFPVLASHPEHN
jgi:hypothetical protein